MLRRHVKSPITLEHAKALLAELETRPRSFILQDKYAQWPPLPERQRGRPIESDEQAHALARSALAKALASPVRMCKVTRQRLPSAFLRAFTIKESTLEPALNKADGKRLYLLDSDRVVRHAQRIMLPKRHARGADATEAIAQSPPTEAEKALSGDRVTRKHTDARLFDSHA